MAKRAPVNDGGSEEWGEAVEVTPKPSGMGVFSLRLSLEELSALRRAAKARSSTVSDLVRSALRLYLGPSTGDVTFSASESDSAGSARITYSLNAPQYFGVQGPDVTTELTPRVTAPR